MTVKELIQYLRAFKGHVPVVVGNANDSTVSPCKANTYYPPHLEETVWVVLDPEKKGSE